RAACPQPEPRSRGGTGPFKEDITMPQSASGPDERARHFAAIRDHARSAVIGLARCRGAELTTRPMLPDSGLTVRDLEPLDGARAARDIELGARHAARNYIRQAREAGHGWDQNGPGLGVAPNPAPTQTGRPAPNAPSPTPAGSPPPDPAARYGGSFPGPCRSCDQAISDRGQVAGPADDEQGHAGECSRLAAAAAEWNA